MKQFSVLLLSFLVFSCSSSPTHKPGIIKTDTIIAEYITVPFGALQGGPAIRVISYKEKITTKDSITFTKSVELDTTATVYTQQPVLDSLTKKPKHDSLGSPLYRTVPFTLPGRYVLDTHLPTH